MDMHANRVADEAARDRKLDRIDGAKPTVKRRSATPQDVD